MAETRALVGHLEAEFTQENAAYQQANPPSPLATNVVPFPRPARRWMSAAAPWLKIAAVFVVLGGLAQVLVRHNSPSPVAMNTPPAPVAAMRQAPAPPPSADDEVPATSAVGAASDKDARGGVAKPEVATPDLAADRVAQASVRRAQVAEAAPGALSRTAPPRPAPLAQPAPSVDGRLAAATVRIRLDDGSYVGGVVLTADGWIMAARALSAINNAGHTTVVLADGREFVPSATAVLQNIRSSLFRVKAASLPTVALATGMPAEGSPLITARVDARSGEVTFQRVPAGGTAGRVTFDGNVGSVDFVFDAAGRLLAQDALPSLAKSTSRARAATLLDKAAPSVRPFSPQERASLTHPPR